MVIIKTMKTAGIKLREWRKRNGISMAVLAGRIGISQPFLSMVERDMKRPSATVADRIEQAVFGAVTLRELLGLGDNRKVKRSERQKGG